jgi:putative membrane protein
MLKILIQWLLTALCFLLTSQLVPGFHVTSLPAALVAAVVVGLLNVLFWPILALLTLPITIVTFGLFLFVVNALVLLFGAALTPGFRIDGLWPAVLGGIVLTLVGWVVRAIFGGGKRRVS